jgi:hypothetical protein
MTLSTQNDQTIVEVQDMQKLCSMLMKYPHYSKLGEAGVFAVIQKAKAMNVDPLEALNGGMYFVNGKVEMQGQMMLSLIRQAGHSISMDTKSTNTHVIMSGKRADNGDIWNVEFSIDDAKRAGIYRGQWEKYPKVMCQWRCVSMLGRFLFSDVIKGCYVEGEIRDAVPFEAKVIMQEPEVSPVTKEQADELISLFVPCAEEFKVKFMKSFMNRFKCEDFYSLPSDCFEKLKVYLLSNQPKQIQENIEKPIQEEALNEQVG